MLIRCHPNNDIILDCQPKIEFGQKLKKELNDQLEKANKNCKGLVQQK